MVDTIVNWDFVDQQLIEGAEGTNIAEKMGISNDTLYRACEREKGCKFAVYKQQKKAIGDDHIRQHQYRKALGLTEAGDNTMLVWLGKVRCGQSEVKKIELNSHENAPQWLKDSLNTSKDLVTDDKSSK